MTATLDAPAAAPVPFGKDGHWWQRRHRLDDPLGDATLLTLFLLAQGWSTWQLVHLGELGGLHYGVQLIPAVLVDGVAFVALREAANRFMPTSHRVAGGAIAALCFASSFLGAITYAHRVPGAPPPGSFEGELHDVLTGGPTLLLVLILVLRTRKAAWREASLVREREAAIAAAQAEKVAREEREHVTTEKDKDRGVTVRLAEIKASAPRESRPAPARESAPANANPQATAPATMTLVPVPNANAGRPEPGAKQKAAREFILEKVAAGEGHTLTGTIVDAAIDGKTTGRAVLSEMRANGECPPKGKTSPAPPWQATSGDTEATG